MANDLRYWIKLIENAAKEKPLAVLITGNPKYLQNPKVNSLAVEFYNEITQILENKGFRVERDPGKEYTSPNENAQVWIGHSRGIDRLRFASKNIKTIALQTKDHGSSYTSNDERGLDPLHYQLSDSDKKKLKDL